MIPVDEFFDVPIITTDNRDIVIKVKPAGSLRVNWSARKYCRGNCIRTRPPWATKPAAHPIRLYGTRDDPSEFYLPYVTPGEHRLMYTINGKSEPLRDAPITVRAGEETKLSVDAPKPLRREFVPQAPAKRIPIHITVTHGGRPIPGAIVRFRGSAPLAPGVIRTNLVNNPGDITDRSGKAHFLLTPGSKIFFAAFDHQHGIAWHEIEIDDEKMEFELDLKPRAEMFPDVPEAGGAQSAPGAEGTPAERACDLLLLDRRGR